MAATTAGPTSPIQLPIISISDPEDPVVGKAMLDAAIKYGFFYVDSIGSDFSKEEVERMFGLSKKFFASPREEKATCSIRTDNRGWSGMHTETLDPEHQRVGDFKEAMNLGEFKNGKAQQPLPPSLIPHEAELDHFATLCNRTCARVMKLLALGLEIPPDFFTTRHHDPSTAAGGRETGCILRLLYYPSLSSPVLSSYGGGQQQQQQKYQEDIDVRAGAHSDYGTITLLFQREGQPGLEILTPDGKWAGVPVWPTTTTTTTTTNSNSITNDHTSSGSGGTTGTGAFPPILVNIGDLLSFWTNGLLKSTIHRVVFPFASSSAASSASTSTSTSAASSTSPEKQDDRYSIVFFCHPLDDTKLVPIPSPLVAERAAAPAEAAAAGAGAGAGAGAEKVGFGGGAGSLDEQRTLTLTAKEYLDHRLRATYGYREEKK